jgi:hypothetical protein
MGYHLTILRTAAGQTQPISRAAFAAAIAASPGWTMAPGGEAATLTADGQEVLTVWWQAGELSGQPPDDDAVAAMLALAGRLGARLRGEELETYRTPTETYAHPDDAPAKQAADAWGEQAKREARRRGRRLNAVLLGVFLLLVLLAWLIDGPP